MVKKEVKKILSQEVKKTFLLNHIISEIENGKCPSQIAKQLKISKQKMSYYVGKLKKQGIIKKIGYGVWQVNQLNKEVKNHTSSNINKEVKNIRGHGLQWKVKHNYNWDNIIKNPLKIHKTTGVKILKINNKKVWFGKKNIIIYSDDSYFGFNAIESKKYAVSDLLDTLKEIETKFNINLQPYTFKATREHYALVKNELAKQYNKAGQKLLVKDNGEGWLVIDDSLGQGGELETIGKRALPLNLQVQNFWNDNKKHNFEIKPTYILQQFEKMQYAILKTQEQVNEVGAGLNTLIKMQMPHLQQNLDKSPQETGGYIG